MIIINSRNTVQKLLILNSVKSLSTHPTADEIHLHVSRSCPGISRATVYRNLNTLAEKGEILRIGIPNAPDRYDKTAYAHAHFHCLTCDCVFDYPLPESVMRALDALGSDNASPACVVSGYNLVVNGECRECSKKHQ